MGPADSGSRGEGMTFLPLGLRPSMRSRYIDSSGSDRARGGSHLGRRIRIILVLATLTLAAVFALAAPRTASGDYFVQECVSGALGNVDAFQIRPYGSATKVRQTDTCTSPYGLRLEANGQSNHGTWVAWQWNAPPGTEFASVQTRVHYWTDGGYGPMMSSNGSPGYAAIGAGGEQWVTPVQTNSTYYAILEQCFARPCFSTTAFAYVDNFLAAVRDLAAPSIAASGELLDSGTVSGVQAVNVTVSDFGAGASRITGYVNGIRSINDGFCGPSYNGAYTSLKPCPASFGPRTLQLDTERGPGWVNGANDLRICGYDAGGNESLCVQRIVQVDNSCGGSGGTAATSLESGADVAGQLRAKAQLTSTAMPVIRGSLRDGGGNPVRGATVCVYQTTDLPDASRELATSVTTQSNGRFATRLDAGPSRDVDVVYRHNTRKLTDRIDLDSRVVPTLRIPKKTVANGDSAVFLGRIPGPNAESRAITLQARVGRKWRTFKQLRTDSDGKFKGKYRFTQTFGRQRYVFRALVKRQGGYPYEPGASRKRKLTVNG